MKFKFSILTSELTGAFKKIEKPFPSMDDMTAAMSTITGLDSAKSSVAIAMTVGSLMPKWFIESANRAEIARSNMEDQFKGIHELFPHIQATDMKEFCNGDPEIDKAIQDRDGSLVEPDDFRFSLLRANRLYKLTSDVMEIEQAKEFIRENESTPMYFDIGYRVLKAKKYKTNPIFDYDPLFNSTTLNLKNLRLEFWWKPLERRLKQRTESLCFTAGIPGMTVWDDYDINRRKNQRRI